MLPLSLESLPIAPRLVFGRHHRNRQTTSLSPSFCAQTKKTTIAADANLNAQDILMAQRVQSKAKSNKKRRQNQKRRKNAAAASKKLQLDAAATDQKEGKMTAVIRMFSPRSSGNGTGGGMASLFSPNAKKTKKVKVVEEPVEEIPSIEEAPSADTADVTVGTAESMEMDSAGTVANNVMEAVEAEAEVVEEVEEEKPVNLLGKSANAPSDECNLQQCIIL